MANDSLRDRGEPRQQIGEPTEIVGAKMGPARPDHHGGIVWLDVGPVDRPVFHQLERRVKAHLLVAFLGYALWVTLKHQLRRCGSGLSPRQALAQLATLQSADIVLPTTDGREIRLRRVAQPTPEQQRLLDQLHITVPAHLEWNAECSGDFAAS